MRDRRAYQVQLIFKAGRSTEVAAATANGPKQPGFFLLAGAHRFSLGTDQLDRHKVSGMKLAAMVTCHCGPLAAGEKATLPLKQFGRHRHDGRVLRPLSYPDGTAVAVRVRVEETAFPHRMEGYNFLVLSQSTDPEMTDRCIAWARETYK